MIHFSCPACGASYSASDRHGGTKVLCDRCGQKLRIPGGRRRTVLAKVEPEPEDEPLPPMDKSVWPLLIKVMMLVVTLLWIGGMLYGATMGFVGTYQDYQVVNREAGIYWNPDKTDFVNRDTVASVALTRAFFLGVCFPTAIYGVVMLLLFVCWFVSRG